MKRAIVRDAFRLEPQPSHQNLLRLAVTARSDQRVEVNLVEKIALRVAAAALPDQRQGAAQRVRRARPVAFRMGDYSIGGGGRHVAPDRRRPAGRAGRDRLVQIGPQRRRAVAPGAGQRVEVLQRQERTDEIARPRLQPVGEAGPAVAHVAPGQLQPGQQGNLVDLILAVIRLLAGDVIVIDRQRRRVVALADREERHVPPVMAVEDGVLAVPRILQPGQKPAPLVAAPFGQHDMCERVLRPAFRPVHFQRAPACRLRVLQKVAFLLPEGEHPQRPGFIREGLHAIAGGGQHPRRVAPVETHGLADLHHDEV